LFSEEENNKVRGKYKSLEEAKKKKDRENVTIT
jgi:hypothetical protein